MIWSELSLCDDVSVWPVAESLFVEPLAQAPAIIASKAAHKTLFFKMFRFIYFSLFFPLFSADELLKVDLRKPRQLRDSRLLRC